MKLGELIKLVQDNFQGHDYLDVRLDFYLMPMNEGMDEDERDDVILKEPVQLSCGEDSLYLELGFKVLESRKENIYSGGILPYKYYFEDINERDEEE